MLIRATFSLASRRDIDKRNGEMQLVPLDNKSHRKTIFQREHVSLSIEVALLNLSIFKRFQSQVNLFSKSHMKILGVQ